jgi:hypothetical protein
MCQRDGVVARALQILAMVLLVALFAETTGAPALLFAADACADACAEGCPDEQRCPGEASERGCAPDCQFCACCGLSMRALIPAAVSLLAAPSTLARFSLTSDGLPAPPEPQAILHVPKRLHA